MSWTSTGEGRSAAKRLQLIPLQEFWTHGAHGWDFFTFTHSSGSALRTVSEEMRFLVVPNYYGNTTVVYVWDRARKKWELAVSIETQGAGQTDHLVLDGRAFVVVGENFGNEVCLYELRVVAGTSSPTSSVGGTISVSAEKIRAHDNSDCLPVPGAASVAVAQDLPRRRTGDGPIPKNQTMIIAASYFDSTPEVTPWQTSTVVWKLKSTSRRAGGNPPPPSTGGTPEELRFDKAQIIPTTGCHDAEFFSDKAFLTKDDAEHQQHHLFLSNDRNLKTPHVPSVLFRWDADSGKFEERARVTTDGAHAAEMFQIKTTQPTVSNSNSEETRKGNSVFVAVANFGDRKGNRFASASTVYRLDEKGLVPVASVPTTGATDWEHFRLKEGPNSWADFLAVSNEGDIAKRTHQMSRIYRVRVEVADVEEAPPAADPLADFRPKTYQHEEL